MDLLDDDSLERSAVVANCRMNRGRVLVGSNAYDKELGLAPMGFLKGQLASGGRVAWLDLCCGSGKALIEAARIVQAEGLSPQTSIVGVDLVGMFLTPELDLDGLRITCRGRREPKWPFRSLGADDRAGPKHTEQPAVDSHYEIARAAPR